MISKSKIDGSFPKGSFLIESFSTPYRLDYDSKSRRIMWYIREDIPFKLIAFEDKLIKSRFIELNLQNTKMLKNCFYNAHKSEIKRHLTELRNSLYLDSSKYKKIFILGKSR